MGLQVEVVSKRVQSALETLGAHIGSVKNSRKGEKRTLSLWNWESARRRFENDVIGILPWFVRNKLVLIVRDAWVLRFSLRNPGTTKALSDHMMQSITQAGGPSKFVYRCTNADDANTMLCSRTWRPIWVDMEEIITSVTSLFRKLAKSRASLEPTEIDLQELVEQTICDAQPMFIPDGRGMDTKSFESGKRAGLLTIPSVLKVDWLVEEVARITNPFFSSDDVWAVIHDLFESGRLQSWSYRHANEDVAHEYVYLQRKLLVLSNLQIKILNTLEGRACTAVSLSTELPYDLSSLSRRGIRPLMDEGQIRNLRGLGYYRPDAIPPELFGTAI